MTVLVDDLRHQNKRGRPKKVYAADKSTYPAVEAKVIIASQVICTVCGKVGGLEPQINAILVREEHERGHIKAVKTLYSGSA